MERESEWISITKNLKRFRTAKNGYKALAFKIISKRKENGWTQSELSQKSDVSIATISRIENLKGTPRIENLLKVTDALNIDINITVLMLGSVG